MNSACGFFLLLLFKGINLYQGSIPNLSRKGKRASYLNRDTRGRHRCILGNIGSLHSCCRWHILVRRRENVERPQQDWVSAPQKTGRRKGVLTVPALLRDRWPSCWVRGPIMEVGWMEMAWSMAGVSTVPCLGTKY